MWCDVKSGKVFFRMLIDAIKVDGVRQTYDPKQLLTLLANLHAVAPTPYLLDLRYVQSRWKINPQPKHYPGGVGMTTALAMREHSERIDKALTVVGYDGNGSIGNVGKHWTWPLEHEGLYGAHVSTFDYVWQGIKLYDCVSKTSGIRVIQPPSLAHTGRNAALVEPTHRDYMMTAMAVHEECMVDGTPTATMDLYRDRAPEAMGGPVLPQRTSLGEKSLAVAHGQQWLAKQGFAPGPIDGLHGRLTEEAWRAYERQQTGVPHPVAAPSFRQARWSSPGRPYGAIRWLVIHSAEVFEHEASAERLQAVCATQERKASWHYAIDNDSITQSVKDEDRAWAAGPANDWGLHLELAGYARQSADDWNDDYSRSMLALASRLVAQKSRAFAVPLRWLTTDEVLVGIPGMVDHATISRASQLAKQRNMQQAPWYRGGLWRTTDHVDPGEHFPRETFLQAAKNA